MKYIKFRLSNQIICVCVFVCLREKERSVVEVLVDDFVLKISPAVLVLLADAMHLRM